MAYSLKEINDAVRSDPKGFVEECDAAYARKIESAARRIADNRSRSRIVLLSGPSGSGKTTTAKKIEARLEEMGIRSHAISMDNYFQTVDPETAPRNREGQIDYESPFCLDMDLLNRHFAMLDRGEKIHVPKFEFARQMRSAIKSSPPRGRGGGGRGAGVSGGGRGPGRAGRGGPMRSPFLRASTPSTTSSPARTPTP